MEKQELTLEEKLWNKEIGKAGVVVTVVGFLVTFAAAYLGLVKQEGGFSKANERIANAVQEEFYKFDNAPRGIGPYE